MTRQSGVCPSVSPLAVSDHATAMVERATWYTCDGLAYVLAQVRPNLPVGSGRTTTVEAAPGASTAYATSGAARATGGVAGYGQLRP